MTWKMFKRFVNLLFKVEIKLPVTWPSGTYGLYMPVSGCPNDPARFQTGYVTQDTEDRSNSNQWTDGIHMQGHLFLIASIYRKVNKMC